MQNEYEIKKEMCEIGRRVYNRGMVAANDGNFSVKLNDNEFLCTPTGVSKGFMTPEYICKVDANGNVIQMCIRDRCTGSFEDNGTAGDSGAHCDNR